MSLEELYEKVINSKFTLCVLGLGRVGFPLSIVFANKGVNTIGVDIDKEKIGKIRSGEIPFKGKDMDLYLKSAI